MILKVRDNNKNISVSVLTQQSRRKKIETVLTNIHLSNQEMQSLIFLFMHVSEDV